MERHLESKVGDQRLVVKAGKEKVENIAVENLFIVGTVTISILKLLAAALSI